MKCPNCKKENNDGVKFCKFCGSPIGGSYKTCSNGHNYDSSLSACPFCPSIEYDKTRLNTSGPEKNVSDNFNNSDRTIIDNSSPTLAPNKPSASNPDKTVIYNPSGNSANPSAPAETSSRKLVGWLVTFDITPNGTDYRLYEGRTRIGRRNTNDIIITQNGISDEHAILLYRDNKFIINDNLSTNGTFINDVMIEDKTTVQNNDIIRLGNINLKLKLI